MTEESVVKCRVCGRRLHNPISRALGSGPKCAGGQPKIGKTAVKTPSPVRRSYAQGTPPIQIVPSIAAGLTDPDRLYRLVTLPLTRSQFRAELVCLKRGTKKKLSRMRARKAFCAGAFLLNEEQCVFEPVNANSWREIQSPRAIGDSSLETYLQQMGVLTPESSVT